MVDGGYYESGNYYFYITDHLGNNRIVTDAAAAVVQSTQYYPFGTSFAEGTTAEQGKQPYKYNGKELDQLLGLNMYDYSARYYESAIGRFTTVDPLAEKSYSQTPYHYCSNNPINRVDPDGMQDQWGSEFYGAHGTRTKRAEIMTDTKEEYIQELKSFNEDEAVVLVGAAAGAIGAGAIAFTGETSIGAALASLTKAVAKKFGQEAPKQAAKESTKQVSKNTKSLYENVTTTRTSKGYRSKSSSVSNTKTNVKKTEFGDNLTKSGYKKTVSKDGKVTTYTKNGKKYSVRENSKSTGESTADYSKNGDLKKKIRLGD